MDWWIIIRSINTLVAYQRSTKVCVFTYVWFPESDHLLVCDLSVSFSWKQWEISSPRTDVLIAQPVRLIISSFISVYHHQQLKRVLPALYVVKWRALIPLSLIAPSSYAHECVYSWLYSYWSVHTCNCECNEYYPRVMNESLCQVYAWIKLVRLFLLVIWKKYRRVTAVVVLDNVSDVRTNLYLLKE